MLHILQGTFLGKTQVKTSEEAIENGKEPWKRVNLDGNAEGD